MKIEIELRPQDAWLKRKTEADIESGEINNVVRKLLRKHYTRLELSVTQEDEAELFEQWLADFRSDNTNATIELHAVQRSWHNYLGQRVFMHGVLRPSNFAILLEEHGASVAYLETMGVEGRTPYAVEFIL